MGTAGFWHVQLKGSANGDCCSRCPCALQLCHEQRATVCMTTMRLVAEATCMHMVTDLLCAGIAGAPFAHSVDGIQMHMAVNHFAHFLLFMELKDLLMSSSKPEFHSRVVNVSSLVHRGQTVMLDDLEWQTRAYNPVRCPLLHAAVEHWEACFATRMAELVASAAANGLSTVTA